MEKKTFAKQNRKEDLKNDVVHKQTSPQLNKKMLQDL